MKCLRIDNNTEKSIRISLVSGMQNITNIWFVFLTWFSYKRDLENQICISLFLSRKILLALL